jgi:hypothetical protein
MAATGAIGPAAEGRYRPAENCGFFEALLPAGGVGELAGVLTRPRSQNGLEAVLRRVKAADCQRLVDGVRAPSGRLACEAVGAPGVPSARTPRPRCSASIEMISRWGRQAATADGCYGGLAANILDEADGRAEAVPSAMLDAPSAITARE